MSTTHLIHHPYRPPEGFCSAQPPTYRASTVFFDSVAQMRAHDWRGRSGYSYGLHGTPSTFALEEKLATLEGATHCILTPSGLASIALANMALLQHADEVLIPGNAYAPSVVFARQQLSRWGIAHALYDPMSPGDLERKISDRTTLVWLEVAGSITLEFPDLLTLVRLCKARGVLCALDNTWGAGLAFNAFDLGEGLGVDLTVHALTKYPSGAANLLMGSIMTRSPSLYERLRLTHMHMGMGVSAVDCESLHAALPSMALRYDAQDTTARQLAQWTRTQACVAQVLHPALPGCAGHTFWRRLTCGPNRPEGRAAAIFSVLFREEYTFAQLEAFCESLRLFKLGYSWAGPVSLVVPYLLEDIREAQVSALARAHRNQGLIRFCIGLEDTAHLQADLQQAFSRLAAAHTRST